MVQENDIWKYFTKVNETEVKEYFNQTTTNI